MDDTYNSEVTLTLWHYIPCGYEEGGRRETGSKGITNVGPDFTEKCLVVSEPVQNLSLFSDVMVGPERHYHGPLSETSRKAPWYGTIEGQLERQHSIDVDLKT